MANYVFGVDVGGTTVKMGLFDKEGNVLEKWEIPTRTENCGEKILPDIAAAIKEKMAQKSIAAEKVAGVGIGVPGPVEKSGIVHKAVNLGWKEMNMKEELTALLGIADDMIKNILPCTACRYCTAHCPKGLDIPMLLKLYNEHCFTGGGFIAPMALMAEPEEKHPSACIGCKSCEAVCPQQIKISEAMADFHKKLQAASF